MNVVAAVDRNWAIGRNGQLLVSIPGDQKRFREETMGKVIIMGRKTFESLPGGRPLPARVNIILTRNQDYQVKGATVCHRMEEALEAVKRYNTDDVFVIGGQEIYERFLPYCHAAYITFIDYEYQADSYFPNLDKNPGWELQCEEEEQTYFDLCYVFRKYVRKK